MAYRTISPDEAAAGMAGGDGTIYLDVRSRKEFTAGHPKGAINIPIMEPNAWGQLSLNEEFLQVVEKLLPKDAKLVIGCLSGKRSEAACQILAESGYTDLANVKGGFGGAKDMLGRVAQPGWIQLGLPVSNDNGEGVSYESLRKKALG
jgi:rhodanese-related sulfurtransferase